VTKHDSCFCSLTGDRAATLLFSVVAAYKQRGAARVDAARNVVENERWNKTFR